MATFFPVRSACPFDTSGERKFAEQLDKKLNEHYLCWFNVPIGPKALQPDFILLHPGHGLLVLEVKDWKPGTLHSLTPSEAMLHTEDGLIRDKNPMEQAREYAMAVKTLLEKDPCLQQTGPYAGSLAMPYSWGVVLPNISRTQFERMGLGKVLEPAAVLCKDEMSASTSSYFEARLLGIFRHSFPCSLSPQQIDRIRYHLYPELRLNPESGQFGLLNEEPAPTPNLIKIMDLQQEQLARSMGSGHRIIHGVAGSGKTMILSYRARYLASLTSKPVLVLCYNKSLASRLRQLLSSGPHANRIHVYHFHAWCGQLLSEQGLRVAEGTAPYFERQITTTRQAVDSSKLDKNKYGAILIDEAHDFEPDWFHIVLSLLDPEQQNLLVLYDDAQSIYEKRSGIGFTFSSVGIQARGRTTILRTNYRNTMEILQVAKGFAQSFLAASDTEEEDSIPTLSPDSAGRKGDMPELYRFPSPQHECEYIIKQVAALIAAGTNPDNIAILVYSHWFASDIQDRLDELGILYASNKNNSSHLFSDTPSVKLITMHSSKGLEFEHVFVARINKIPEQDSDKHARLLYVAMTRAIENLTLTCHQESPFTRQVQQAIQQVTH